MKVGARDGHARCGAAIALLVVVSALAACGGTGSELAPIAPVPVPMRLAALGVAEDGSIEVSCSELIAARPVVFLAFGQSIASNFNQTPYRPQNAAYSIDAGRCFEARDPLRGADGSMGSMWSYLADELEPTLIPYTAFVTIGVGGSSIAQWDTGGSLNARLTRAVDLTRRAGFGIDYVLWHQGSADRGTPPEQYKARFLSMIRSLGPHGVLPGTAPGQAKVLVAVHSRCGGEPAPALAAVQRELVDPPNGYFAGADTDALGSDLRYDGCHLSTAGQQVAARLWRDRINAAAGYASTP